MDLSQIVTKADLAFENNDFASALNLYHQAHQLSPKDANLARNIGLCCFFTDELSSAVKWLKYTLSLTPYDITLHNSIGEVYLFEGDYDNAVRHLSKAIEISPDFAEAHANLSESYRYIDQHELAIRHATLASSLNATLEAPDRILCISNYYIGNYQLAIFHGEKHLAQFGATGDNIFHIAESYQSLGRYDKAFDAHQMVLGLDGAAEAYHFFSKYQTARINIRFGKIDQAITEFKQYIREDPNQPLYYGGLAKAYGAKEDDQGVLKTVDSALNLEDNTEIPDLLLAKAQALFRMKRREEGAALLKDIVEFDPENAEIWRNVADLFYDQLQNIERAITFYKKSLEIAPSDLITLSSLGLLYRSEGLYYEGITCYTTMLEIDPSSSFGYDGLGECYRLTNQLHKAIDCFQKVLAENPDDSSALYSIGQCYSELNLLEEAKKYFYKCYQIAKDWIMSYEGLGDIHKQIADKYEDENNLLAIQNYMSAKKYYEEGLAVDEHFNLIHHGLSLLPAVCFKKDEWNPLGHLLRAIFLAEKSRYNTIVIFQHKDLILERIIGYDLPMLPFTLLGNASEDVSGQQYIHPELERLNQMTGSFRTLFHLTSEEPLSDEQGSLIPLLMFHLGDPVSSYRFYRDREKISFSLLDHYYYAISAESIIEPRHNDFLLDFSVPFVYSFIKDKKPTLSEAFYASEILSIAGMDTDAGLLRKQLEDYGFLPSLIRKNEPHEDGIDLASDQFANTQSNKLLRYFQLPSVINLTWGDDDLSNLMPLIHLLECKDYFPHIDRIFFAQQVRIGFLEGSNREDFIKKNFAHKHILIYGNQEQKIWVGRRVTALLSNSYNSQEDILSEVGLEILVSANQQLTDLKGNVKNYLKVNYKNYILLADQLFSLNRITLRNKQILQHYIIYCAAAVDAFIPDSIPGNPLVDEAMSIADTLSSYFIYFPISKILSVKDFLTGLYFRRVGKEREILTIESFILEEWEDNAVSE